MAGNATLHDNLPDVVANEHINYVDGAATQAIITTGILTIGGNASLGNTTTGSRTFIYIADNGPSNFLITEPATGVNYMDIDTVDGFERIDFGNATTNPDYAFLGSGTVITIGDVEVNSDTSKLYFGTGQDVSLLFDGDDFILQNDAATTEELNFVAFVSYNFDNDIATTNNIQIPLTTSATVGVIEVGGSRFIHTNEPVQQASSKSNIFIGENAGSFTLDNTTQDYYGAGNVALGENVLSSLTTGHYNMGIGSGSLLDVTTGDSNVAVGYQAGANILAGDGNMILGRDAGVAINSGSYNVAISQNALRTLTTGIENVAIGFASMRSCAVGVNRCIAIGSSAGRDEDASDRLIIDNLDRTTAAATRTDAIIYGVMAAAPANQVLTVNAELEINGDLNHDGSNAGFFGTAPVVQQTGCAVPTDLATAITAITVLRTALNNLGLTTVV